jgi:hypothetical protein
MTTPALAAHTSALLERLATTGLPVGDARAPRDGGWQGAEGSSSFRTYLVLYPLDVMRAGPNAALQGRYTQPQLRYQVTTVGLDRHATQVGADLAAAALLDTTLDIDGWSTVLLVHDESSGVERDEDVNPPLFFVADRYRLETSTT